jgi:5-formyltetrahydrofolate cyclo-ligase
LNTKAELRAASLAARSRLSPSQREAASARIVEEIAAHPRFGEAKTIALYSAIKDEADPAGLAAPALAAEKTLAYPRIAAGELELVAATPAELTARGSFGIREPPPSLPALPPGAIDLVIVPGVAFTRAGDRIGYGKGYYDRLLRRARAENAAVFAIGFAFEVQIIAELPTEDFDERLDAVATETALTLSHPPAL